jgi:hypothetical protein
LFFHKCEVHSIFVFFADFLKLAQFCLF